MKHVEPQRDEAISQSVPEIEDARPRRSQEPRSHHNVSFKPNDRIQQARVLHGVVLQIRILEQDIGAGSSLKTAFDSSPFSEILLILNQSAVQVGIPRQQFHCPIG